MRITKLQLIDHGIEHEQYFQGCGVSFTSYSYCVTGIGDDIREAIEDCLDQIAMQHTGVDNWPFVERLICEQQLGAYEMNDIRSESVSDHIAAERGAMADNHEDADDLDYDLHYYVSIRYSLRQQ